MQPTVSLNSQIATLNSANAELIKINNMLASVQSSLTDLSQPANFNSVDATSSDPSDVAATGIPGVSASPGTYTIDSTSLATSTVVTGAATIGHVMSDTMPGTTATGMDVPLADSYAAVTPTNGSASTGSITINGVSVNYDVNTQSLTTILNNINAAEHAAGDASFNMSVSGNTAQIADGSQPISLGSPSDSGNLLQVLHLDTAQVNNTASSGSVIASTGIGGVNQGLEFNSQNAIGGTTNANYLTPVTSGTFTINGVSITLNNATDNLASVLKRINASAAGVNASYDATTGQITIVSKSTGPQSIVLGASGDTSNFLSATGLTAASGATVSVGQQSSVTLQTPTGGTHTIYGNSNTVTAAIPGVSLNLLANTSAPFQVTVSQDSSQLVTALNTFVSAYNAAISEINTATSPPIVVSSPAGSSVGGASQSAGGGVLYGNSDVQSIKDQLVNMVTSLNTSGGAYNSLSTIGLQLTDSFSQIQADSSGSYSAQTLAGTDGQLQPLDVTALQNALAANPNAVSNLINGASGLITQIGTYLTGVTGVPTNTATSLLGAIPSVSLIQGFENANTASITSIQQQVKQITDNVNMQADQLRQEFVSTESTMAGLQALQQQVSSYFSSNSGSSGG